MPYHYLLPLLFVCAAVALHLVFFNSSPDLTQNESFTCGKHNNYQCQIAIVVGTRPDFIKLAPVITELQQKLQTFAHHREHDSSFSTPKNCNLHVLSTGQHAQLLRQAFSAFPHVNVQFDLSLMQLNQSVHDFIGNAIPNVANLLKLINPRLVIVQGDTASAFSAAVAAHLLHIPIAHVEAGMLR